MLNILELGLPRHAQLVIHLKLQSEFWGMTDAQLYLATGVPVVSNALMFLLFSTMINFRFTAFEAAMNQRLAAFQSAMNQRFNNMRELWRTEFRRVEEVLDARLRHIEEAQDK